MRPGEPTDATFLEKLDKNLGQHPHYISHSTDAAARKSIGRDVRSTAYVLYNSKRAFLLFFWGEKIMNVLILMLYFQEFRLLHFAGEVTYSIQGFLDKNNDLLFRDLKEVWYLVL